MNVSYGKRVVAHLLAELGKDVARDGGRPAWFLNLGRHPAGHDNLFSPVEEDRGSHGPFDGQAHGFSPQYELAKRRGLVLAGVGAAALGAGAAAARATR